MSSPPAVVPITLRPGGSITLGEYGVDLKNTSNKPVYIRSSKRAFRISRRKHARYGQRK